MAQCSNCGTTLHQDEKICMMCGTENGLIQQNTQKEASSNERSGKMVNTAGAFCLGFFLGLIGLCIVLSCGNEACKKQGKLGFFIQLGISAGYILLYVIIAVASVA